jgi:hypothetical protein
MKASLKDKIKTAQQKAFPHQRGGWIVHITLDYYTIFVERNHLFNITLE